MKVLNYTGLQNLWTNIKNYITVHTPTKTSDLTNDSGFLTSTDISSKANDSEVLHKAQTETVTGEKTFKKDVKIIDLNANERPGVKFEVNGTFRTFEDAKDALPDTDFGDFGVDTVWSAFWLDDNTKIQNSMSDYVINDITFGTTGVSSVIEFNNYYKVKYEEADNVQTDLRGMLRFELLPYAGVQKDSMIWTEPNLYFYAKLDNDESGNTILGHEDVHWSKAYIDEINCYEIKFGGNSIRDILENIVSLSYVTHYSSTSLTSNSTNSLSIIDNQDSVRVNDKVIDSSGKMFYITSVDLDNDEFTVGSVVDAFAKDSGVVHNSGNETVGGIKSFSDDTFVKSLNFTNEVASQSSSGYALFPIIATVTYTDQSSSQFVRLNLRITADNVKSFFPHDNNVSLGLSTRCWSDFFTYHGYFRGQQQGDEYSGNARTNLTLLANRDSLGQSGCVVDAFRENTSQGTGMHILGFGMKENSVRYEGCRLQWQYDSVNSGYNFNLKPNVQGTNVPLTYNLGTSSDKWDTINGLEPSVLGMPDLNSGVDISSYITTGDTDNNYTPPVNGWIWIRLIGNGAGIIQGDFGTNASYVTNNVTSEKWVETNLFVTKNVQATIRCRGITGLISAKFYPCLGNV